MKKVNVEERNMLVENGFVFDEEMNVWYFEDWCICKDRGYVEELRSDYNGGCRVCWMNKDRYVKGLEFVLVNDCDDGVWFCGSVEECLSIIEEYYEEV